MLLLVCFIFVTIGTSQPTPCTNGLDCATATASSGSVCISGFCGCVNDEDCFYDIYFPVCSGGTCSVCVTDEQCPTACFTGPGCYGTQPTNSIIRSQCPTSTFGIVNYVDISGGPIVCGCLDDTDCSGGRHCSVISVRNNLVLTSVTYETASVPFASSMGRCLGGGTSSCSSYHDCTNPLLPICANGLCMACDIVDFWGIEFDYCMMNIGPGNSRCNKATGACVQCITDDNCKAQGGGFCKNGVCTSCTTNSDCTDGNNNYCNTNTGQCVACLSSSFFTTCPLGKACIQGVCRGCEYTGCLQGVCDQTINKCVCSADSQCGIDTPVCNLANGICEATCISDSQCGSKGNYKCNIYLGVCRPPCATSLYCSATYPNCDIRTGTCNNAPCDNRVITQFFPDGSQNLVLCAGFCDSGSCVDVIYSGTDLYKRVFVTFDTLATLSIYCGTLTPTRPVGWVLGLLDTTGHIAGLNLMCTSKSAGFPTFKTYVITTYPLTAIPKIHMGI